MPDETAASRRFLVALSFPGEKRGFVCAVAEHLRVALGQEKVFYDAWYEHELARANLDTYLQEIYGEKSALVVPFFCEDYEKKPWCCKVEWLAIRAALTFGDRKDDFLMAMRFDKAPIKGFLQIHGYVAIGDRPPQEIADLILKRLEDMDLYSTHKGNPLQAPRNGCVHNLPFASIGGLLCGRDEDVTALMRGTGAAAISQAIQGMGGVGKTRLAVELGWKAVKSGDFESVLFAIADSPESLQYNLAQLAVNPLGMLQREQVTDTPAVFEAVLNQLNARDGWFLILDNVDTDDAAESVIKILPRLTRGRLLITSRRHGWPASVEPKNLQVLSREEGAKYLLDATRDRTPHPARERSDAETLAENLGGLPLALEQAAAYINWFRGSFGDYLQDWEVRREHLLSWTKGMDPSLIPVALTYERTVKVLSPTAKALLRLCAFLSPEPIPVFLFEEVDSLLKEAVELLLLEGNHKPSPLIANPKLAIAELAHFSLIERESEAFMVHRMVQEVLRIEIPKQNLWHWIEKVLRMISEVTPAEDEDVRTWIILDPLFPHLKSVCSYSSQVKESSLVTRLLRILYLYLRGKARFREAEYFGRQALQIDEETLPTDHPDVATSLNNLAQLLLETNRPAEAEPLMRRALEIDKNALGSNHPAVAIDLNNLAQLLKTTNRLKEAEGLMRRALEIDENTLGPYHPAVAIDLSNLAQLLKATNRLKGVEGLMRRALEIDRHAFGNHHPNVARHYNNLGTLFAETERLDEAEPLIRLALAINEDAFTPNHPTVANSLNNLAMLLMGTNRTLEAEPLYRRALRIDEDAFGPNHPKVANRLHNLATVLQEINQLAEAEILMRRALEIDEAAFGQDHPEVGVHLNNLAKLLQQTDRLADAEPIMRRHLEIFLKFTRDNGRPHPHLKHGTDNYAHLLHDMGRTEKEIRKELDGLLAKYGVSLRDGE